jgi:hypothetical protein
MRLAEDGPFKYSLTGQVVAGGRSSSKGKKIKKKRLRLPDVARVKCSLTGTGRGGGPLEFKI